MAGARRTSAEIAQDALNKATERVEKAEKRVEKAEAEVTKAKREVALAERARDYAASHPDLQTAEAEPETDVEV
jgi:vacuolar-type H+-ATPase subunit H